MHSLTPDYRAKLRFDAQQLTKLQARWLPRPMNAEEERGNTQ
jgi:hypothetical protein